MILNSLPVYTRIMPSLLYLLLPLVVLGSPLSSPPHPQACSYQPALARVSCQCSQPGTATSLSIKWKMFQPELCCSNADHLVIFTPSPGCSYSAPVLPGADPLSGPVRSQPSQPHSAGQGLWTVEDWKYQVRSGY